MVYSKFPAKASIECSYFTRPGAKVDYSKIVNYTRSKTAQKKLYEFSGDFEVSAGYDLFSGDLKTSWASVQNLSTQTEEEEYSSKESRVEYYPNTTLLVRSVKYTYFIDGEVVVHVDQSIVQDVKEQYSLDQLRAEGRKYMETKYGIKNSNQLELPLELNKKTEIWKSFKKGDILPNNAVYAGYTATDGAVFVARFDNTPGKVNLKNGRINTFWSPGFKNGRYSGEILLTTRNYKWVEIKQGQSIPAGAVRNPGSDVVYIGKINFAALKVHGEPGKLVSYPNAATMNCIYSHHYAIYHGAAKHGHILVYTM